MTTLAHWRDRWRAIIESAGVPASLAHLRDDIAGAEEAEVPNLVGALRQLLQFALLPNDRAALRTALGSVVASRLAMEVVATPELRRAQDRRDTLRRQRDLVRTADPAKSALVGQVAALTEELQQLRAAVAAAEHRAERAARDLEDSNR